MPRVPPLDRPAGGRWAILDTHAGSVTVRVEPFTEINFDLGAMWVDPPAPSGQ